MMSVAFQFKSDGWDRNKEFLHGVGNREPSVPEAGVRFVVDVDWVLMP